VELTIDSYGLIFRARRIAAVDDGDAGKNGCRRSLVQRSVGSVGATDPILVEGGTP
jgi:hypothetical protein